MGLISDKSCRVDLAYCRDINYVYNAVGYAAQMCGFNIELADRNNYIINLSKSISLFTWGERIYIAMGVIPDGRTGVTIISQPNLGTEIVARKQNQKNVEMLVNMINQYM